MNAKRNSNGFVSIGLALVLLLIAVTAYVGVRAYNARQAADRLSESVPAAPEISTAEDLSVAEQTIDAIDPDSGNIDVLELDAHLATF